MIKYLAGIAIMLGVGFVACTNQTDSNSQTQKADTAANPTTDNMKNFISIVEIPTADFSRAVSFYQALLTIQIEKVDMGEMRMGVFPGGGTVNVTLVGGNDYKPSANGTTVYLNGGDDLQTILDKVEPNGGKVLVPKTEISPEMGFFALFTDTEGNKLGLHSPH